MGKVRLDPDFREFFKSLNAARIRYLLLGGYAVNFYGYQRFTENTDVWVATDAENCQRLSKMLVQSGGFRAAQVSPGALAERGAIFVIGREPIRIDITNDPKGVDFEACWSRRNEVNLDGINVPMISLADLRANKVATGRPQDVADVSRMPEAWPVRDRPHKSARRRRPR